ncbi:unnamed protein product, partial [Ectocarpus fasciculatus]
VAATGDSLEPELFPSGGASRRQLALWVSGIPQTSGAEIGKGSLRGCSSSVCQRVETVDIHGNAAGPMAAAAARKASTP